MNVWKNICVKAKDAYNAAMSKQGIENSQQYTEKLKAIKELKHIAIQKHIKALREELNELNSLENAAKTLYSQQCTIEMTKEKQKRLLASLQGVNNA